MYLRTSLAAAAALAVASAASATVVSFDDLQLGTPNGTNQSKSYTDSGVTVNITTPDGSMNHIGSGQFAGLWIGENVSALGTYTFDFGPGNGATMFEFEFDAASAGGGSPPERLFDFTQVGGTPTVSVGGVADMTVNGAGSLATLELIATLDDGQATITITSPTPMTSISFTHEQNPSNNGLVIERLLMDVTAVPEPAGLAALAPLAIGLLARRRRPR